MLIFVCHLVMKRQVLNLKYDVTADLKGKKFTKGYISKGVVSVFKKRNLETPATLLKQMNMLVPSDCTSMTF